MENPKSVTSKTSRGIQSVEVGGQLLQALVASGQGMALKDLAQAAGMSPAKAHPYLVSFGKLGLISQDPTSGHYALGSLALQLGLIALKEVDPVRLAINALPQLALELGCTVCVAVWGEHAPVIVRVEEAPTAVRVAMRHGTPASIKHTGTGKVFAAYWPRADIERALKAQGQGGALNDPGFAKELKWVRKHGLGVVKGELLAGINAMAVPVFDAQERLVMSIAALAPSALLDLDPQGSAAKKLRAAAQSLSKSLGAAGPSG
jgi:DNA-binding IclR family transcriptional regulator